MNNTEQWLLEGDCRLCRKEKYCSNKCTSRKKYESRNIYNLVSKAMMTRMLGVPENKKEGEII